MNAARDVSNSLSIFFVFSDGDEGSQIGGDDNDDNGDSEEGRRV